MNNKEISKNRLFLTNYYFKINKPLFLSSFLKVKLRNMTPNEVDLFILSAIKELEKLMKDITKREFVSVIKKSEGNFDRDIISKEISFSKQIDIWRIWKMIAFYIYENNIQDYDIENLTFTITGLHSYLKNYLSKIVILEFKNVDFIFNTFGTYIGKKLTDPLDYFDLLHNFHDGFIEFINSLYPEKIDRYGEPLILSVGITANSTYHKVLNFLQIDFNILEDIERNKNLMLVMKQKLIDKFLNSNEKNLNKFFFFLKLLDKTGDNNRVRNYFFITIIESLLINKPDNDRYNVEETITKQFVNKISTILAKNKFIHNEKELVSLKRELRIIYDYRSSLLHGDIGNLNKTLKQILNIEWYANKYKNSKYLQDDSLLRSAEELINIRLNCFFKILFIEYSKNHVFIEALK